MLRHKHKFYEPTARQQQEKKVADLYELINQQERNMADILDKYENKQHVEPPSSRIKQRDRGQGSSLVKSRRSASNNVSLILPIIGRPHLQIQSKRKKHKNKQASRYEKNPYFFELAVAQDKTRFNGMVEKAYFSDKSTKLKAKAKIQSDKRKRQPSKLAESKSSKAVKLRSDTETEGNYASLVAAQQKKELPLPLSYFKNRAQEQSSSSEEGDVPLAYYQKEYRRMIREQCLEQTNFLYFSKNTEMKDWTQNLLLLFERHDKELALLRRRCKYLSRFDNNYFSIDIFNDA